MSQENVEVVRRLVRAFNDGEVDAILAELDPTVDWEEQPIAGVDPVYHGHDGVRRWAEAVRGPELRSLRVHVEALASAGDAVVASVTTRGEGRTSGVEVQMSFHLVFTFREGKVVRRQVFHRRDAALDAVGLSE
jgi:ketosteroid isomerase-like protein